MDGVRLLSVLPFAHRFLQNADSMEETASSAKTISPSILAIGMSNEDLCTRCGTCVGACPTQAIELDDRRFPRLIPDRCTECRLCHTTCPGARVDYLRLTQLTFGHDRDDPSFDGHVLETYMGYCTDERIRSGGAGGGIVTALCWDLLKHGDVDGCIVARMNPDVPWRGEAFIARSYEELLESQGSKYTIVPVNAIFQEVRRLPGRYAYVALPCQAHGFRLLLAEEPALREKIPYVIGLFCGGALEPNLVTELLEARGIDVGNVREFKFRGGDWPGRMQAVLKDGTVRDLHESNYKDGAYNYFTGLYMPKRCQTCIDGSGQFADISISDAWTRDDQGKYLYESHSRMLARTPAGVELLHRAIERGTIVAHDVTRDANYKTHKIQTKRKGTNAPLRVARLLRAGNGAPIYDRPPPEATLREKLTERGASFLLWMGQFRWFRFPLMKFLTSRGALPLIRFRLWRKKRKYARSAKRKASKSN